MGEHKLRGCHHCEHEDEYGDLTRGTGCEKWGIGAYVVAAVCDRHRSDRCHLAERIALSFVSVRCIVVPLPNLEELFQCQSERAGRSLLTFRIAAYDLIVFPQQLLTLLLIDVSHGRDDLRTHTSLEQAILLLRIQRKYLPGSF